MTDRKLPTIRSLRFDASQRKALDAIGDALKHRRIDFFMATELSDLVKAGQVDAVLETLNRLVRQK